MEENACSRPVVEENFLEAARKENRLFKIFLINGFQMEVRIIEHDELSIKVRNERLKTQLIYKYAISTIEELK